MRQGSLTTCFLLVSGLIVAGCQSNPSQSDSALPSPGQEGNGWPKNSPYEKPQYELDAGTQVVLRFYKMLLSDQPPTADDEKAIFCENSLLSAYLKSTGDKNDAAPLCNLARKNAHHYRAKRVFFRGLPDIGVTSSYHVVASLNGAAMQAEPGSGYVMATFSDDELDQPHRQRVVRFRIFDNKIDLDWTHTGYWHTESIHRQTIPIHDNPTP